MYKKIRVFNKPYNGAYIKKDNKILKIWRAELIE
jgi:methionyl-tRNA formyltransferase